MTRPPYFQRHKYDLFLTTLVRPLLIHGDLMKENLRNVILIVIFFTFVLQWKQRFHGSGSLMSLQEAERNHHLITLFLGGGGSPAR